MRPIETEVPSIAGIAAMDTLAALRELVGEPAYVAAREEMPPDAVRELDAMSAVAWFPNATFNLIIDELARAAGADAESLLDRAIRLATQRTFKTVWRVLLRVTTDEALIKRTPMIYARGRNVGQMNARMLAPGHAEADLVGWPDISDRTLRSIGVGMQCVVELAGRREVRMNHARTPDGGHYDVRWKT